MNLEIFNLERVSRRSHARLRRFFKPLGLNNFATGKILFPDPLWFDSTYHNSTKQKTPRMGDFLFH